MPRKMKQLLEGWGIRADKRSFGQAGVTRVRKYGGVAVKKEVDGLADGGGTRGGSCFCCLMGGSVIGLLGSRVGVRLRFE